MPIYEYQCKKCGEVTEVLQGFDDKPLKKCKSCRGRIERIISLSAFHLKGTGWYETDHGKKKITQEKDLKTHDNPPPAADNVDSSSVDTGGAHTANNAKEKLDSIKKDTAKAKSKSKKS